MSSADDSHMSTESTYNMDVTESEQNTTGTDRSTETTAAFADETFPTGCTFEVKHVSVHFQNISENITV